MPLVVGVWEPPPSESDATTKLPGYRDRGDREIWHLHPYERTLTAWRRRPDGGYAEAVSRGGIVRPAFLSGVATDLDVLFGN